MVMPVYDAVDEQVTYDATYRFDVTSISVHTVRQFQQYTNVSGKSITARWSRGAIIAAPPAVHIRLPMAYLVRSASPSSIPNPPLKSDLDNLPNGGFICTNSPSAVSTFTVVLLDGFAMIAAMFGFMSLPMAVSPMVRSTPNLSNPVRLIWWVGSFAVGVTLIMV
jgi:hypothetical protein